jgi:hypothetical protein
MLESNQGLTLKAEQYETCKISCLLSSALTSLKQEEQNQLTVYVAANQSSTNRDTAACTHIAKTQVICIKVPAGLADYLVLVND